MRKNYVLDTNVLLQDGEAIYKFQDNNVFLPITVVDELDNLKESRNPEVAYQARRANRILRPFVQTSQLPNGGHLFFVGEEKVPNWPDALDYSKPDHAILRSVLLVQKQFPNEQTILITQDNSLAIKAYQFFQIPVEDYRNQQIISHYTGRASIVVSSQDIEEFYQTGACPVPSNLDLYPNEFLILQNNSNPTNTALAVYRNGQAVKLQQEKAPMFGIKPLNMGQQFAKEALLSDIDSAPLVIMQGPAGTAKTFLSLAAGLQMLESGKVGQVLLLRPQSFFDSEIGYLPGSEQDKIEPLMRPFTDNLSVLLRTQGFSQHEVASFVERYSAAGIIRAESFAYIRGRSISDTFIILDEAQNATRSQIKGAITRAGIGSKIVITGDPQQVDNPALNAQNNGLVYAVESMKKSDLSYILTFSEKECKRSPLAKDAISRLQ